MIVAFGLVFLFLCTVAFIVHKNWEEYKKNYQSEKAEFWIALSGIFFFIVGIVLATNPHILI